MPDSWAQAQTAHSPCSFGLSADQKATKSSLKMPFSLAEYCGDRTGHLSKAQREDDGNDDGDDNDGEDSEDDEDSRDDDNI